jgi:hypothetical protein
MTTVVMWLRTTLAKDGPVEPGHDELTNEDTEQKSPVIAHRAFRI